MENLHVNKVMRYHHAFTYFEGFKFPYPLAVTLDGMTFDQYLEGIAAERLLCNKPQRLLHEEWAVLESIVSPEKSSLLGFDKLNSTATLNAVIGSGTSIIRIPALNCIPLLRDTFQPVLLEALSTRTLKPPFLLCAAYCDALFTFWLKSRSQTGVLASAIKQLRDMTWPNSTIVRFLANHNTIARGALGVITFTPPHANNNKSPGTTPVFVAANGVIQAITKTDVESVTTPELDFSTLELFIESARLNVNPFDCKATLADVASLILTTPHDIQARYLKEVIAGLHVLDNPTITKFDLDVNKYPLTWHVKPRSSTAYALTLGKFPGHNTVNWLYGIPFSRMNPNYPKQFIT